VLLLRKKLAVVLAAALMLALSSVPAFAAANPSGTGPPNQSCEEQPSSPPGFGTQGFSNAETHYNPGSQYDTACFQVSHKGGSNR
jgi:Spy/CpxP family protein refolding chaperone